MLGIMSSVNTEVILLLFLHIPPSGGGGRAKRKRTTNQIKPDQLKSSKHTISERIVGLKLSFWWQSILCSEYDFVQTCYLPCISLRDRPLKCVIYISVWTFPEIHKTTLKQFVVWKAKLEGHSFPCNCVLYPWTPLSAITLDYTYSLWQSPWAEESSI